MRTADGATAFTSSEVIRVEVDGKLQVTRVEYRHFSDDPTQESFIGDYLRARRLKTHAVRRPRRATQMRGIISG